MGGIIAVFREDIIKVLNETGAGGAGYAVWGGGWGRSFGNPSSGGRFYGRGFGFGGSASGGGPNIMYTYAVKPLNQTLQPPPTTQDVTYPIHKGTLVRGKRFLGKDWKVGRIIAIRKDAEGNILHFLILDEKGRRLQLDPTSTRPYEETNINFSERDIVEGHWPSFKEWLKI